MKTSKAVLALGGVLALGLVACASDDPADPGNLPVAAFQAAPATGDAPLSVSFSDASTGSPSSWSWDFGDGGTSLERNPDHVYVAAGTYTVTLTVTNAAGSDFMMDVDCVSVAAVGGGDPPVADFTAAPLAGNAPLAVSFDDASTGGATVWKWDFGDGGGSGERDPDHTYETPGVYTVSLTAANAYGSHTETKTDLVTAREVAVTPPGATSDHTKVAAFADIPAAWVGAVAADLRLYYAHTSHGNQLMVGMDLLESEDAAYAQPQVVEIHDDLGQQGDTSWMNITRAHLDAPGSDTNVVVWAWCDGVRYSSDEQIEAYLANMTALEQEYPDVVFVYMTGHLFDPVRDPSDVTGRHNDMIRAYCATQGKWLFDFADIESYDPDGVFQEGATDRCDWCVTWCATHDCPDCPVLCDHSHCLNCYLKGKAFWWLLARIAGWEG